jgi:signal transduction histidine kinase
MKTKKIIALLTVLLLTGCFCASTVVHFQPYKKNDIVTINRIVQEVTEHWSSLPEGNYKDYKYSFCVLSSDNRLLYQSSADSVNTVIEALANGDIIMDIEQNNEIAGKVIITTNTRTLLKTLQKRLALIIVLFFTAFTFLCGFYFFYLHKKIIHPFHNLEGFAHEIANGNLDFMLKSNKENIFGSFTQSFDIMREQLKIAKHQEFLANQSKKELVASLSHDIKTPVTSIKLTSELLMVTTEDKKMKDKLNTIYQKAEQINLLVTDLFHATLEDLEKLKVTPVETYSSVLESFIREADCYDKITMSHIPDCMLSVDPLRLNQVIANVIYNSYKYANTPIDIHFDIKNRYLEVYIQDYGNGVDEEDLPLLFNKFYRGKNAATESGSGLGLYICKKLLDQMEGEIYCNNNEQGFVTLIFLKLA